MRDKGNAASPVRMSALTNEQMDSVQLAAAQELIAGPRKGVKGPFISLLRSPELMARLQKVGEFLRFQSSLSPKASEFATLVVSRTWTQQFEWFTHIPLALKAGTSQVTLDDLREGRRPSSMDEEERMIYDFTSELLSNRGVSQSTYEEAVRRFSERGVVELVSLIGYFVLISMVLNVSHIPEEPNEEVDPLEALPR